MFVTVSHFHRSLTFVGESCIVLHPSRLKPRLEILVEKADSVGYYDRSSTRVGSTLGWKCYTRVEVTNSDKHSNFLWFGKSLKLIKNGLNKLERYIKQVSKELPATNALAYLAHS